MGLGKLLRCWSISTLLKLFVAAFTRAIRSSKSLFGGDGYKSVAAAAVVVVVADGMEALMPKAELPSSRKSTTFVAGIALIGLQLQFRSHQ